MWSWVKKNWKVVAGAVAGAVGGYVGGSEGAALVGVGATLGTHGVVDAARRVGEFARSKGGK